MAIRVSREGFGTAMDPGAVGVQASGAYTWDDGTRPAPWTDRPWQSAAEGAIGDTLRLMSLPSGALAQIRPPVPYQLFPEQELGYAYEQPTIEMILDTERWSPQIRSWFSPTIQAPPPRAQMTDDTYSGSPRGAGGQSV